MPIHPIKFRHHSKLVQKLAWHFVFGAPTVINLWDTLLLGIHLRIKPWCVLDFL